MPRNGTGTYSLPSGNPIGANSLSNSSEMNTTLEDLRDALTASVARDGQSPPTADMPWGTQKITALKDATGSADAANLKVIQNRVGVYCGTVGGTADAITLTPSPAITALVAGQRFSFIAGGANTVAVTVNVSATGVKSITKRGATALVAGDIVSASIVTIEYDGTRFQLVSPIGAALGDMSIQNKAAVNIDGGTIDGVTIVGGSITGMTDIVVADGGTGKSTLTNKNLIIGQGTNAVAFIAPGTSGNVLSSDGTDWSSSAPPVAAGSQVQAVHVEDSAYATGATAIPVDDTIPVKTEGDEYMTLAITPTNASNKLVIEAIGYVGSNYGAVSVIAMALFQDATTNALAVGITQYATGNIMYGVTLRHEMVAGTTSATTFKIRIGNAGGSIYFNGQTAARRYGGVLASHIRITEIKV